MRLDASTDFMKRTTVEQRLWQAATKPMTLAELALAVDAAASGVGGQVRRMVKMGSLERTGLAYTYKRVGTMLLSDRRRLDALVNLYGSEALIAELRLDGEMSG